MYKHNEKLFGKHSADIILQKFFKLFTIHSAIDVGCGIGAFIESLKKNGISDVKGIDGPWTEKELLQKHMSLNDFIEHDLNSSIYKTDKKYDVAICLEVAEHIKPQCELNVVKTLIGLSDTILFSAAIPKQGGQGHINEQWPSHWKKLFNQYGYDFVDIIRPLIWGNLEVHRWYRQNIFVVVKQEKVLELYQKFHQLYPTAAILDIVHPEYWSNS